MPEVKVTVLMQREELPTFEQKQAAYDLAILLEANAIMDRMGLFVLDHAITAARSVYAAQCWRPEAPGLLPNHEGRRHDERA